MSDRNSMDIYSFLRTGVAVNLLDQSLQNRRNPPTSDQDNQVAYVEETVEDVTLRYLKTRTPHVDDPIDGEDNPIKMEEICVICHDKFEHEENIGTLGCGHEYHARCIKQWLVIKKDCPICRASVLPFRSTKAIQMRRH
ncbi:RING finger protein 148-like [Solanum pennellii]|uniref:RING-type E3 ubiquitin transferase n=1 Tax=Solanum pennellii TaxID=28526 RepID=A0ABM1FQT6_SOLPN|nr:RING finger protein 148-like [Solanum pennellii]